MIYNFDKVIDRKNTDCRKWDALEEQFGTKPSIPMWIADMDFDCPLPVSNAIQKRAAHCVYGYLYEHNGYEKAIKSWIKKRHGYNADSMNCTTSPGIVPAISMAVQEFSKEGDYVLIQQPVYYPFAQVIQENNRLIINNPMIYEDNQFKVDFEDFKTKVEKYKPKIFIICNPHNPVGRSLTKEELKKLGDVCTENGVIIVSDEIHSDIIYKDYKHTPMWSVGEEIAEHCITFYAPSKTFNIAGLKASAVLIKNDELFKRFLHRREADHHGGLNVFAPVAFEAAYNECEDYADQLIEYLEGNKNFLENYLLKNMPKLIMSKTQATYLPFVNCRGLGLNDMELEKFMLEKADIAFDMGIHFGDEGSGFIRVNIACPRSVLKDALDKLHSAYTKCLY